MTQRRPTIGVVAISYNEERDMPGFLANLLPWVDEIVIVDDGSSDKTAELALAAGSKVNFILSPRIEGEYYADQRNKGINAAQSDWLLHLDIDERASADLANEIKEVLTRGEHDAYRYRRLNYFLNRPMQGGDWADWNQVHLAKREVLRFGGMFHETCDVTVSDDKIGQLDGLMFHINDESYAERLQKSSNYQEEVMAWVREREGRVSAWNVIWAFAREFIVKFFFKKGILDGVPGVIWAFHASNAAFRARALVWDEQNQIKRADLEEKISQMWEDHQ